MSPYPIMGSLATPIRATSGLGSGKCRCGRRISDNKAQCLGCKQAGEARAEAEVERVLATPIPWEAAAE